MIIRHEFATAQALANALAQAVVDKLQDGIEKRGAAVIAVSGGSTPKRFFAALSHCDLEWNKVMITLVDERWVDAKSDRSNAKLVQELLLQNGRLAAQFLPLWSGGEQPDTQAILATNDRLLALPQPFDAVILGMGTDGHTASFFPGGDTLHEALHAHGPALAIRAPGAEEPRVTLTLPTVLSTRSLFLHIEGADKAITLANALEDGPVEEMPVRAVLRQSQVPLNIYSC